MAEPGAREASQRFGAGRIVMVVAGALVALLGLGLLGGGTLLVWAHTTQRDGAGYYTTSTEHFATPTYALTAPVDLGETPAEDDWFFDHPVGTVRIRANSATPAFVGIGRQPDVDRWLAGVAHERVEGADFGPFDSDSTVVTGNRPPGSPLDQGFWVASVSGAGRQTLRWPSEPGRWTIVVMNADATAGVTADVDAGARTAILLPIGLGLAALSLLFLAGATALMFFGLRHQVAAAPEAAATPIHVAPADTYPARLDGHLDPNLSRWLWLVKWVLLIPHAIVLGFLWLAVTMLTAVAGVSILFTGRYPRSIFDFNLGVMRWTWRVSFYAISAFGTDRYPPFSLRPEPDYPATFTVDYPEHLSRGLVLVKWWLLALPHYLVVALFAGGWGIGWMGSWRIAGGSGLIAVLALIAAIVLAIRGRYPEPIFDFVNRLRDGDEPLVLPGARLRRADA
ncbi:MAG TPA: DUF4389 domain-containing protein [Acidimicrobiia bacterium]|nr:DUF4389 domain-containing protein [Acidimicrobiia bacterium]